MNKKEKLELLWKSIDIEDIATLSSLIDDGVSIEVRSGPSPLQIASMRGYATIVNLLISRGAKVDYISKGSGYIPGGGSALHYAIQYYRYLYPNRAPRPEDGDILHESFETIRLLVEGGSPLGKPTKRGETPLLMACRKGHSDVALLLLDHGSPPFDHWSEDSLRRTPLIFAVENDMPEVTARLIAVEVDPRASIKWGQRQTYTPLIAAAKNGADAAIRILLDAGVEVDARDNTGATALYHAVRMGKLSTVRLLLAQGANPDAKLTFGGSSPREHAFSNSWIAGARSAGYAGYDPADEALVSAIRAAFDEV